MVDPINGCTEVNLHDPSLLPTLQCTLQCLEHSQKCITGTPTFSVHKLGGRKHTTAFHKSSKTNRHQACSNTLDNTDLMELVGNWRQKRTVDLSEFGQHWPVSSKPGNYPGTKKPPKHYTKMVAITSAVLLRTANGSAPP